MTLQTAMSYRQAGLCVLPARGDEKRPAVATWKDYQRRLPTDDELQSWFGPRNSRNPQNDTALCIVAGTISGNLEMIDFDLGGELFDPWAELVEAEAPGLLSRLFTERSQGGGRHVVYRTEHAVSGNLKLAQRVVVAPSADPVAIAGKQFVPRRVDDRYEVLITLIETRGEGGVFLCHPTPGYQALQGELTALAVLSEHERDVLFAAAWSLNEHVPEPIAASTEDGISVAGAGARPGDDYNRSGNPKEMLLQHGWSVARTSGGGGNEYWRRPGKDRGWSATLKAGVLYVFSSNAPPFEPNRAYSPFAVYGLLEHGGDFAKAASALRTLGYGKALSENVAVDLTQFQTSNPRPEASPTAGASAWRPFPTDALPEPVATYVQQAAQAAMLDDATIAVPILGALAGAIGNARRVRLKNGWSEPCIVWAAISMRSGDGKSPALDAATRFARDEQLRELERYRQETAEWEKAAAQAQANGEEEPPEPHPPKRVLANDTTIEALVKMLAEQPRGILLERDELAGWLGSFDRYARASGADRPFWLAAHGGRPHIVDRKTSGTLMAPSCAVSIVGAIQPGILEAQVTQQDRDSGLLARLLLASPPVPEQSWTEAEVDGSTLNVMEGVFRWLFDLDMLRAEKGPEPIDIPLSPEAKKIWVPWFNSAKRRQRTTADDDMHAAWSKLIGYAARLALIFELVERANTVVSAAEAPRPFDAAILAGAGDIRASVLDAAIMVVEWFVAEEERLYSRLCADEQDRDLDDLIVWIERKGGRVTVRDVTRGPRRFRGKAGDAFAALDGLVKQGRGTWQEQPPTASGGQPTRVFALNASEHVEASNPESVATQPP
ncbi:MAG: DUF3987 domain-containing protein [Phycisphaerales bacterium]|nr:DUF3987 domain-containing protein [Phycisphaerales bacterium]MCI0674945.1 DUF3987 domain-containing protein [Phycisphaerales bacterium]